MVFSVLFTQGCFVPSLVEIDPVVLEKIFSNFVNAFLLFLLLSPLGKGHGSSLEWIWNTLSRFALCKVCGSWEKDKMWIKG